MSSPLNTKQVLGSVSLLDTMSTNIFLWQSLVTTCKQIVSSSFKKKKKKELNSSTNLTSKLFQILKELKGAKFISSMVQFLSCIKNSYSAILRRGRSNHIGSLYIFTFFAFCSHVNKEEKTLWINCELRICLGLKHRFSDHGQNNVNKGSFFSFTPKFS